MLRSLFHEPRRKDEGLYLEVNRLIERYCGDIRRKIRREGKDDSSFRRREVWCRGMIRALDELEQSIYCCKRYMERIRSAGFVDDMASEERDDYYRHLYFYKNAVVRLFSLLDKTGYFLDDSLQLKTEEVKPKFSFFTVLRRMKEKRGSSPLTLRLSLLKNDYQAPLHELRKQRNVEVHWINVEMLDDLWLNENAFEQRTRVENVRNNVRLLDQGFEMVLLALQTVFRDESILKPARKKGIAKRAIPGHSFRFPHR